MRRGRWGERAWPERVPDIDAGQAVASFKTFFQAVASFKTKFKFSWILSVMEV